MSRISLICPNVERTCRAHAPRRYDSIGAASVSITMIAFDVSDGQTDQPSVRRRPSDQLSGMDQVASYAMAGRFAVRDSERDLVIGTC